MCFLRQEVFHSIIQIFNKDKTRVLNPWLQPRDIRRIQAMQKLLGAAVTKA
jgi:hypothetical protein